MSDDCANPDRLAGEEIPAEIIKLVEEKFQEIQSAYEVVTKSRKSPRCPAIIPPMSTCATATVFKSRYTDGILHRPHRMEDTTMRMKKTIQLTLAALLGLSGALPAVATEYQASDYLPLAVGNSWTYDHEYYDIERRFGDRSQWSAYLAQAPESPQFTIEVLRTEELDGQTYYVISEMPSNWPPPPPHFIAGKKLRWEGTQLMERTAEGEQGGSDEGRRAHPRGARDTQATQTTLRRRLALGPRRVARRRRRGSDRGGRGRGAAS